MRLTLMVPVVVGGLVLAAGCFVAGVFVGEAPLRQSAALTGGYPGRIATQFSNLANAFGNRHGSYGKDDVVDVQVQLAGEQSVLAAQVYCQMTPMYRELAQRAAHRLSVSPLIQNASNSTWRAARAYVTSTPIDTTTACSRFQDASIAHHGSGRADPVSMN